MNELFREAGKRILRTVLDYRDRRERSRQYDGIISIDDVMSGEVIKVDRGLYDHYGIFVRTLGRNGHSELHAIQYTGRNGHNDFNGIVKETPLDDFLDGASEFMVCRYSGSTCTARLLVPNVCSSRDSTSSCTLTGYTADPEGRRAVERARSRIGTEGYSLPVNNCEHFAVWCRTGVSDSSQVRDVLHAVITPE
ncbi:MAG: lecithin retinol acyltransferase family protein [Synergistaceae bacterium]|nr:lecithin retinol acyltransferase family protein [Synergistaceae bacterium]